MQANVVIWIHGRSLSCGLNKEDKNKTLHLELLHRGKDGYITDQHHGVKISHLMNSSLTEDDNSSCSIQTSSSGPARHLNILTYTNTPTKFNLVL